MDEIIKYVGVILGSGVFTLLIQQWGKRQEWSAQDSVTQRSEWIRRVEILEKDVVDLRNTLEEKQFIIATLQSENAQCFAEQIVLRDKIESLRARVAELEVKP